MHKVTHSITQPLDFGSITYHSTTWFWLPWGFQRMLWPAPRRNSSTVLFPSRLSTHNWWRRDCSWVYTRLTRLQGGSPRAALRRVVLTWAESALSQWISFHTEGWETPHKCSILWFYKIVSALFAINSHLVNIPYMWWEERSDVAEHDGVLSVTIWSVALNPSVGTSTVGGVEVVEKRFHSFWCIVAKELEACRQIIDRKQSQWIHHTTEQFNVLRVLVVLSKTQVLHLPPCRLGKMVETPLHCYLVP